ncbi:unnamed protein product [Parnassius apollo]|uniref:chitinase n=1 Tax=Parnassius apollo TaxID=110799 RepID=A0A8S3WPG1_PARAO|nr:unnamed protein product [Parnassius apollo]
MLFTIFTNSVTAKEKSVICYYGSWATYRSAFGKFDVDHIDTNLCTHLVYSFVGINTEGTVKSLDPYLDLPDNWGRNNFGKFNSLKIGKPNLKTILAVGGWNEGSQKFSRMAANPTLRKNFISSAIKMILDYGFDGLNIDWEYPNRRDSVHGPADIQNFVQLLKELRQEFNKHGLTLSAAVASVKKMAIQSYDIPGISKYLDAVSLMTYDLHGPWDPVTGHNSPLHKGEGDGNIPKEDLYTVDVALEYWIKSGCPPEKIRLGLPLYGHTFTLTNAKVNRVHAPSSGPGLAGPYTATKGIIGYNEFCSKILKESWDIRRDNMAMVPYAVQGQNWVSYDDASSLKTKVEYGMKHNISGIMVWSIETDDFHGLCGNEKYPLLRSINRALGNLNNTIANSTAIPTTSTTSTTTIATTWATTATISTGTSSICKIVGLAADPEDCTSFYMCTRNIWGALVPQKFKCPANLYWDNKNLYCNYPDQVECSI